MRHFHQFASLVVTAGIALAAWPACATLVLLDNFPVLPLSFEAGGTSSAVTLSIAEDASGTANLTAFQVALDF